MGRFDVDDLRHKIIEKKKNAVGIRKSINTSNLKNRLLEKKRFSKALQSKLKSARARNTFDGFLFQTPLLRALNDCGMKYSTKIQNQFLPIAMIGKDVICQGKDSGKSTIYVLHILQQFQQFKEVDNIIALILCPNGSVSFSVHKQFKKLSKYIDEVKIAVLFGGVPVEQDAATLRDEKPNIVIGTPARISILIKNKQINLSKLKHLVIDECEKIFDESMMQHHVNDIFKIGNTPYCKQVIMMGTDLPTGLRSTCKQFMKNPSEIYETGRSVNLDNLEQYYVNLIESDKEQKLGELLINLEFNRAVIFVNSIPKCMEVTEFLLNNNFPAVGVHDGLIRRDRLSSLQDLEKGRQTIMVTTNFECPDMDLVGVNVVINFDTPWDPESYLNRVGICDSEGLVITFMSSNNDANILNDVQDKLDLNISHLPEDSE